MFGVIPSNLDFPFWILSQSFGENFLEAVRQNLECKAWDQAYNQGVVLLSTASVIAERLSARLLIVQYSGRIWASIYIYVNACNFFSPGGKHVLKMGSSLDSVEERWRLQGRVRTQRYRDHQNEDARARRRQSDCDRWRAARQRDTEARRRPLASAGASWKKVCLYYSAH